MVLSKFHRICCVIPIRQQDNGQWTTDGGARSEINSPHVVTYSLRRCKRLLCGAVVGIMYIRITWIYNDNRSAFSLCRPPSVSPSAAHPDNVRKLPWIWMTSHYSYSDAFHRRHLPRPVAACCATPTASAFRWQQLQPVTAASCVRWARSSSGAKLPLHRRSLELSRFSVHRQLIVDPKEAQSPQLVICWRADIQILRFNLSNSRGSISNRRQLASWCLVIANVTVWRNKNLSVSCVSLSAFSLSPLIASGVVCFEMRNFAISTFISSLNFVFVESF